MSSAERKQANADLFDEYHERRQYLAILDQQLRELGERMEHLGKSLRRGGSYVDAETLETTAVEIGTKLEDYRATRDRCSGLLQGLGRFGYSDTLKGLDSYPVR